VRHLASAVTSFEIVKGHAPASTKGRVPQCVENSFPKMPLDLRGLKARLNSLKSNLQGVEGGIR
jgi:hypothetical protein